MIRRPEGLRENSVVPYGTLDVLPNLTQRWSAGLPSSAPTTLHCGRNAISSSTTCLEIGF